MIVEPPYLNNYSNLSFLWHPACGVYHTFEYPMPAVVSQNFANKNCSVCDMSEKYAFWSPLDSLDH